MKKDAAYWKAQIATQSAPNEAARTKAVDEFIAFAPKDERGANLLLSLSYRLNGSRRQAEGPVPRGSSINTPTAAGPSRPGEACRRLDAVGKPFDLEFTEAISGTDISMKGLKGKVVVVDFWATWCGPCVAEMPKMKTLYAEYKDKGVEFIGVSLDQKEGGSTSSRSSSRRKGSPGPSTTRATAGRASSQPPGASTRSRPSSSSTRRASSTRSRLAASSRR